LASFYCDIGTGSRQCDYGAWNSCSPIITLDLVSPSCSLSPPLINSTYSW
jgi:hypothetical protein